MIRMGAVALAVILGLGVPAAPALADADEPFDLEVSASFDKPTYLLRDPIRVRVMIRNAGPGVARYVRADPVHGTVGINGPEWGELQPVYGKGIDIGPGQAVELDLPGYVDNVSAGMEPVAHLELLVRSWVLEEANLDNNGVTIEVPVTIPSGTYRGTVMGDGAPLRGVKIQLLGGDPQADYVQTTDDAGTFAFPDIPTGNYSASFDVPGSWTIDPIDELFVGVGDNSPALIRAKRFSQTLTASVEFTRSTYAVDEPVHLTIVLTNTGTTGMTGITALCTGPGHGYEISAVGAGWDEVGTDGPGIALRAGETRMLDEWSPMPVLALRYGFVTAECQFGSQLNSESNPVGFARARVPGGIGGVGSRLMHDRNSDGKADGDEGVADTKVMLVDPDTHQVVARTVTGADGTFLFTGVSAYLYELRVIGPWKLVDGEVTLQVRDGIVDTGLVEAVLVVPGPDQPDPDNPPTSPGDPVPQGGVTPAALAATGPGVIGLAIWGLLAVVLGLGMLIVTARNEASCDR